MTKTKYLIRTSCLLFTLSAPFILQGCSMVGVAAGTGAAVGIAASQEGGLSRAAKDAVIQAEINDLWFRYDVDMFTKLDITVNNGRVLLTGVVQNPEHRVEAVRLAWQPKGVQQVINEIRVAESQGLQGFAKDTWITTQLRTKLTLDKEILSINYSIDTVQGTVYLMGFAQNRFELNRVVELARTIKGVNGVVSYVKFVGGEGEVSNSPDTGVTYDETSSDPAAYNDSGYDQGYYNDTYNNPDSTGAPYSDSSAPIDVRAPQDRAGSREYYPNNVEPIEVEQLDDQIIIRDTRAPQGQGLTPQDRYVGPSSESLLEPTTDLPNATIQKVEPVGGGY